MNRNQRKQAKNVLKMKRCKICHRTDSLTIDHKKPIVKGGSDKIENLQCLCKRCNGFKGDLTNSRFRGLLKYGVLVAEMRGKITRIK